MEPYNPVLVFALGSLCGLCATASVVLGEWLRRRDPARRRDQRWRSGYTWARIALYGVMLVAIKVAVGVAVNSPVAVPHLEWTLGALLGAGIPPAVWYFPRRRASNGAAQ